MRWCYYSGRHWKRRREKAPAKVLRHKTKPILCLFQLSVELIMLVAAGLLTSHHVKDLLVLLVAGRALRITLTVGLEAVLMVAMQTEEMHSGQLKLLTTR